MILTHLFVGKGQDSASPTSTAAERDQEQEIRVRFETSALRLTGDIWAIQTGSD